MAQTQLFVTDMGDINIGIPELTFVVDVPILIEDINNLTEGELYKLSRFRDKIIFLYQDYAEGRVYADYDYETIPENEN